MKQWTIWVIVGAALISATMALSHQASPVHERWSERLELLTPADPLAYFELAEEIADDAGRDTEAARMARHLYGLSASLDPDRLGRSACLAMAALADSNDEQRRLLALADMLTSSQSASYVVGKAADGIDVASPEGRAAALALSEAFSRYRQGDGAKAIDVLERTGVLELLDEVISALPWRSARAFVDACAAQRGREPSLPEKSLVSMLAVERYLLGGSDRSWGTELVFSYGSALIEVDPKQLDEALDVDVSRPYFRKGRWIANDE